MWFMGKNFTLVLGALCGAMLVACNGGGGSSSGGGGGGSNPDFATDPTPPSATMPAGTYNVNGESVPYSQLGQPIGLVEPYPNAFWPNGLPSLQIAYGNNSESNIANLTAYVTMGGSLCSATPVKYDSVSGTTFLIGAAHCFVDNKTSATTLNSANLSPTSLLKVYYGVSKESANGTSYPVKAVYLRQDYCYNATFGIGGHCPNFSPSDGANTQGNDIAVIQISGQFGDPESYPQVVPASEYPTPYTAAPVLSVGYGLNTQTPVTDDRFLPRSSMFYVANYQYWQQDSTPLGQGGYHYLYNSFYNSGGFEQSGYSALICGGDSGGGDLFWTGTKWILLSEHTYGPGGACGTFYTSLPNGATNVSAYYDWIQSILTNLAPAANCSAGNIVNCVTNG